MPKGRKSTKVVQKNETLGTDRKEAVSSDKTQESGQTPSNFEEELSWCIVQLELGLQKKGATREQKEHNLQIIKKLESTKAPLAKKRQVMRNTFGDYRSQMKVNPLPKANPPRLLESTKQTTSELPGKYYKTSKSGVSEEDPTRQGKKTVSTEPPKDSNSKIQFKFDFEIQNPS